MAEQQEQSGNIRMEYNNATTGLNMDQTVNQIPKGKLTYALNAVVENFDANSVNYQNEPGNEPCFDFPSGYVLIGTHFIQEKNKHVFFITNPNTGDSQIGFMENNDCTYRVLVNAPCLNFNINYPIHKIVHKITNCSTEVYWTDGYNPRRYLDIDNIPKILKSGTPLCNPEYTDDVDCNQLNLQPNFKIPQLKVIDVTSIGNLIAGTYQFAIQYADSQGNPYTSYYSVTNPTPIADEFVTNVNFNYPVGKSIILNVSDLEDTGLYDYFNVAVIKTINGITSVELIGTYYIDSLQKEITYTGQNVSQIRLAIDDIFEKFPYYDIAQDVTTAQDVLIWSNLTSVDRFNYQSIASKITLQWQTYKLPATENYADELNATNLRGYLRDEVYAFEIVFLLRNGRQTDGFHIPGRELDNDKLLPDVPDTNSDFIGEPDYISGGIGYSPYWKIYNTATVVGTASGPNIGNATPYQYGEFAYWESVETYPCNKNVWGDLAGKPIRHHKFPDVSVSPIFENPQILYNPDGTYKVEMTAASVFPIGVKIDVQQIQSLIATSDLTQEQKDEIVGFKIVRGDRGTNKSIVAKGILRNVGKYKREETEYYYPNYPYNDLNTDPFLLDKNNAFVGECATYRITPTISGEVTYVDCVTGNPSRIDVLSGIKKEVCSVGFPKFVSPAAGTIDIVSWATWEIRMISGNANFIWTNPSTLTTVTQSLTEGSLITVNSTIKPFTLSANKHTVVQIGETQNLICSGNPLKAFDTDDSKYRMVFNSPETSFGQPFLGNILKLESAIFGAGKAHFVTVKNNAKYKLITKEAQLDALASSEKIANITSPFSATAMFTAYQAYLTIYINGITRKNYAYSFNSIAQYDYWSGIDNNLGVKQRPLEINRYLIPGVQNVGDNKNINNYNRESSVYLKTIDERNRNPVDALPFANKTPSLDLGPNSRITDTSRFTISEKGNCINPTEEKAINVVSYYGSLKNVFVNQWGQIYSYDTIDTGFQVNIANPNTPKVQTVFGGDTFISRFAFKTKLPFFIDNRVNAPDDSDIFYDEIGNVAYPRYWHSARSILVDYNTTVTPSTLLKNIISYKAHNFDCPNNQADLESNPGRTYYDGKFYLFAYGVPSFYCESSYNLDLRQAFNNREGDFWPHVSSGIPDDWVQETFVPIAQDNTYYYNTSFSKQNRENTFTHLPVDWGKPCYTFYPFRAIYSESQNIDSDNRVNSWLIYRPVSYFDFPQNFGDLTSLDGIQNRAVLARFENKTLMYNNLLTIDTSNPQAAYVGNPMLFRGAPPIDFAETDLGYVGSQHKMLLKIPFGQVTIDAKRGQVFLINGTQAIDLSGFGSGLNRFFTEHMAFEILRFFPNVNVDNHFAGIGLHGVFDTKYERILITKLDYTPKVDGIIYDEEQRQFFYNDKISKTVTVKVPIFVTDEEYFCNRSFTVSYNFNTKSWISFHGYFPNWYIGENNFFYSGINDCCEDFDVLAGTYSSIIPSTTTSTTTTRFISTTTTTTTTIYCDLAGIAEVVNCNLPGGSAVIIP